ncbi:MAG: tetratricopeptide repeat protein [Elusimicrobia bacterium]|nr:tetratricopeptide repeat protein [Elusimicrobiota bacterium]
MGKQWVRAQVKRNEMQEAVDRGLRWAADNRQTAGVGAGVIAAVLLFAGLFLYSHRAKQSAAWEELSLANGLAYAGQVDAALKKVDDLNAAYTGTPASGFGLLFAGDLLFHRDRFADSVKYYQQLADRGQPQALLPLALGGMALAQESASQCAEAVKTEERFLGAYPDHFLAPQVHASMARCEEAMGQKDTAKATLQKIALQYPETSWAAWAQEQLKALGGGV